MSSIAACISQLRWYGSLNHKRHNSVSLSLHRVNRVSVATDATTIGSSFPQRTCTNRDTNGPVRISPPTNRRNNICQCQRLCRRHEYTIRRRAWGYSSHESSSRGQGHCAIQAGHVLQELTQGFKRASRNNCLTVVAGRDQRRNTPLIDYTWQTAGEPLPVPASATAAATASARAAAAWATSATVRAASSSSLASSRWLPLFITKTETWEIHKVYCIVSLIDVGISAAIAEHHSYAESEKRCRYDGSFPPPSTARSASASPSASASALASASESA